MSIHPSNKQEELAKARLLKERKNWNRFRPTLQLGFSAKPEKGTDGVLDLFKWQCIIPGKPGTDWEGGYYPLTMEFPPEYPTRPPKCKFPQEFFHVNVYPAGTVSMPLLCVDNCEWLACTTVQQLLLAIQDFLNEPNVDSPAQSNAYTVYTKDQTGYGRKVRRQATSYPHP